MRKKNTTKHHLDKREAATEDIAEYLEAALARQLNAGADKHFDNPDDYDALLRAIQSRLKNFMAVKCVEQANQKEWDRVQSTSAGEHPYAQWLKATATHGPAATEHVEKPERLPTDDGDTPSASVTTPIDRIFDPPALTIEQLRKLAVRVGAQDAVDRGDVDAAKLILAQLGHFPPDP